MLAPTLTGTTGMPVLSNLINAGTIIHGPTAGDLGNGSLASPGSGTLTNLAGGVHDFQTDKNVAIETFINRGTLRKSAGAGTAIMEPRNFNNEGGTIDVQVGTLQISGPLNSLVSGLSTGGTFRVDWRGARPDQRGRTVRYSGSYTGSGAGIVRVRAGVLEVGAAGATFNFPPGLFQWTGGDIAAGLTGLTNVASISLAGTEHKFLSGTFNNAGTVTHAGTGDLNLTHTQLVIGPNGTFNNLAGGVYDLASDVRIRTGVFNNYGTLRKSSLGSPRRTSVPASTTLAARLTSAGGHS